MSPGMTSVATMSSPVCWRGGTVTSARSNMAGGREQERVRPKQPTLQFAGLARPPAAALSAAASWVEDDDAHRKSAAPDQLGVLLPVGPLSHDDGPLPYVWNSQGGRYHLSSLRQLVAQS